MTLEQTIRLLLIIIGASSVAGLGLAAIAWLLQEEPPAPSELHDPGAGLP